MKELGMALLHFLLAIVKFFGTVIAGILSIAAIVAVFYGGFRLGVLFIDWLF
tara:strand:+ start:8420 stop:8575 length:156 start_codon:yes stop_codon:yes gene_type:complete